MAKRCNIKRGLSPTYHPFPNAAKGGYNITMKFDEFVASGAPAGKAGLPERSEGRAAKPNESAKASGASPAHGGASRDNRTHEHETKNVRPPERERAKARERAPLPSTKRPPP